MLRAFSLAVEQLPDRAFRRVLLQSVGLTLLAYLVCGLGLSYGLQQIPQIDIPVVSWAIDFLAAAGFAYLAIFFFPVVASLFLGLFLDDIAEAVEQRYYPDRRPGRMLPFLPALLAALRFTLVVVVLNLLALPLYLILLFFPPASIALFYCLNGYLLGREYFELVAMRHLPPRNARILRKANRGQIFLAGLTFSFLLTLPLLNLLVPLLATAAMVHIFNRLNAVS